MPFISQGTLKLVKFCVNYAYFFRVIPFRWKRGQNESIEFPESGKDDLGWKVMRWFIFAHQLSLSFNIGQSMLLHGQNKPIVQYVVEGAMYSQFLIICVIQLSLIVNRRDWVTFFNHYVSFYRTVAGKPSTRLISI